MNDQNNVVPPELIVELTLEEVDHVAGGDAGGPFKGGGGSFGGGGASGSW